MNVKVLKRYENERFFVRIVELSDTGFRAEMLKSKKANRLTAEFLLSQIAKGSKIVWAFKKCHPKYKGIAKLIKINDEFAIVLISHCCYLDQVILVNSLETDNSSTDPLSLSKMVELKETLAHLSWLTPKWSKEEQVLVDEFARIKAEKERAKNIKTMLTRGMATTLVTIQGERKKVHVAKSVGQVEELNRRGLNGGTLVMAPKEDTPGVFTVFSLNDDIETVGYVGRKATAW